ncbi:thymidine phosphorylase [Stomatohabitans albus]|uniref:thymidine phosphorylase n=1 Tax=Stomatohabitans albus TaxID=3110766 RepID=UPI00300C1F9A
MNPVDLIAIKRDGGTLTKEQYEWMITNWIEETGVIDDAQVSAFLMAGVLRGFSKAETSFLTEVLLESGETLDLSGLSGPTVDKHSTGGVGDGTTLVVAPLLAACGVQVVKLSGRGLGHTGGTLDKLESIPGMQINLEDTRIMAIAEDVGCVVAGQTADIVPADKKLYALRDVTGTVASRALIASSVMSKKLASGADTIILDVKTGDGGFMKDRESAVALAKTCLEIGQRAGRNTRAIVSDMNTPLSGGIGNSLEIIEVVHTLSHNPAGRFADVCLTLATLGLSEATGISTADARERLVNAWTSGEALERLQRMIEAQGGDPQVCIEPVDVLPAAPVQRELVAPRDTQIARIPAMRIGEIALNLGAGRTHAGDSIDHSVGLELLVEEGESIEKGQPVCVIHARNDEDADVAQAAVVETIVFGEGQVADTILEVL